MVHPKTQISYLKIELLDIFSNELLPLSFFEGKIIDENISVKQMASFKKGVYQKTPCY